MSLKESIFRFCGEAQPVLFLLSFAAFILCMVFLGAAYL
jgi:hypothetical protein